MKHQSNNRLKPLGLLLIAAVLAAASGCSFAEPDTAERPALVGKIKPRSAKQISSSSWSVGGETLDRDFAVYASYKKFIGPLGAKGLRLQAGWAKCEKTPGVYDWKWIDEAVDDALAQGVQPWLEFNYGNPVYPGGGDTGLGGGFPSSPEALAAWDRWVRALVERYHDRVHEWEVWNEPDLNSDGTATVEAYLDLYIRTANIVRAIQPQGKSKIYALALCHDLRYAEKFITGMAARNQLHLIDAVTIHTYPQNPDETRNIDEVRQMIARTGHAIEVRQGETGAPSRYQEGFALRKLPWTENMQAKWNLRRMLAHHGKDVPFNLFTMIDLHYQRNGKLDMNYKGLLASKEDQTVAYAKPAYFAAQNVFAIFDNSFVRITNFMATASVTNKLAAFAYTNKTTSAQIVTLWFKDGMPSDSNTKTFVDLTFSQAHFKNPVYVDLLTGEVFALPKPVHRASFQRIPLYDSPILIAEKAALPLDTKPAR